MARAHQLLFHRLKPEASCNSSTLSKHAVPSLAVPLPIENLGILNITELIVVLVSCCLGPLLEMAQPPQSSRARTTPFGGVNVKMNKKLSPSRGCTGGHVLLECFFGMIILEVRYHFFFTLSWTGSSLRRKVQNAFR